MNGKRKRFIVALKKYIERSNQAGITLKVEKFATDFGFSTDTVWAWLAGRRKPTKGTMNLLGKVIQIKTKEDRNEEIN